MLAVLVLLAASDAAIKPAPTPTPVVVEKAGIGQTRTLADVARERKLGKKGVAGGTMSVAGASGGSETQVKAQNAKMQAEYDATDAAWQARFDATKKELSLAQASLAQADATMPNVVSFGRPGAAHAIALEAREGALLPYRMRVKDAEAAMAALREEASRAGVPGLVR